MDVGTIELNGASDEVKERLEAAVQWCRAQDPVTLTCGRHAIDGNRVFANVMRIDTTPADAKDFEAHRNYIDVHYVFFGHEAMGLAPVDGCKPVGEFDGKDDFGLYTNPDLDHETWVNLGPGQFVVTPPSEAHKPGCCSGESKPLFKACVKVLAD